MSADVCDGCGAEVPLAGGIANFWTMEGSETRGMILEFAADDSEHFLCFACAERLPENPTTEDVSDL